MTPSFDQNVHPLLWGVVPSGATASPVTGIVGYTNDGVGVTDYSGLVDMMTKHGVGYNPHFRMLVPSSMSLSMLGLHVNELLPFQYVSRHRETERHITHKEFIRNSGQWQRNVDFSSIHELIGEFALKYTIIDYKDVRDFLLENEFLASTVYRTVLKIKEYFQDTIEDLYLKVQKDPEDETESEMLYLQVKSSHRIERAYTTLKTFQQEWFIPTVGTKIVLFTVDII